MGAPRRDLPRLALVPFCFECVDEVNCREEPNALSMMLDNLYANPLARRVFRVPGPPTRTAL
jgi:hypothetical protein